MKSLAQLGWGYDEHCDQEMYDFYDKGPYIATSRGTAPVVPFLCGRTLKLFAPEVQKPVRESVVGSVFTLGRLKASNARVSPDWCRVLDLTVCYRCKVIAMAAQFFKDVGIANVA